MKKSRSLQKKWMGRILFKLQEMRWGVFYAHNVEYADIDSVKLHLQIMMPYSRNDPEPVCPCVVFVQGSAWGRRMCYFR